MNPCITDQSQSIRSIIFTLTLLLAAAASAVFAQEVAPAPPPASAIAPEATPAASAATAQPAVDREAQGPTAGFVAEPRFIRRAINLATRTIGDGSGTKSGLYPEFANMPTGAGWISAGPGYRQYLFHDGLVIDSSAAVSWRLYKMAQARIELPKLAHSRVSAGSQVMWQDLTQVTYFGIGPETADGNRSEYRMKYTDLTGYATLRPVRWLSLGGRVGWLHRPTLLNPAGSFKRGNPATQTIFTDDPVYELTEQPNYLHSELTVTADTRDSRSHPSSGGVYRAAFANYADENAATFSFRRYEAEAAQFVPLADRRIVLAVHGWMTATDTDPGQVIPFYLMPSLGGANTLRAYTDFRFHDRNLLVLTAESRFALFSHVDLAAFADAGNVAARVGDLNLDKRTYGIGVRMHTGRATIARLDVAHGADGWRIVVRTNDPLHLSRLSRRTAAAPFVP
jgi:Omp85 superfamily domain